jgi:hypothetical protein
MREWIGGVALAAALAAAAPAQGAEIRFSCGFQELEVKLCEEAAQAWSAESGHQVTVIRGPERSNERYFEYLNLLGRSDPGLDVLQIDVIWPSAFADQLVDLSDQVPPEVVGQYFPALVANNTVDGRLVALPWFTDAGILYYRSDLLAKYGLEVPETWSELADAALVIQEGERAANAQFWGLVFEGQAYEGLTCNALEWIAANGGGRIVDEEGNVTVNNPAAALALARAAAWVGTVAPPRVTQFVEEDARITFQLGNAAFMRNWPYAWALLNAEDSALRGKVGVAPLPRGGLRGRARLRPLPHQRGRAEAARHRRLLRADHPRPVRRPRGAGGQSLLRRVRRRPAGRGGAALGDHRQAVRPGLDPVLGGGPRHAERQRHGARQPRPSGGPPAPDQGPRRLVTPRGCRAPWPSTRRPAWAKMLL